jgi:hypothetical protein
LSFSRQAARREAHGNPKRRPALIAFVALTMIVEGFVAVAPALRALHR